MSAEREPQWNHRLVTLGPAGSQTILIEGDRVAIASLVPVEINLHEVGAAEDDRIVIYLGPRFNRTEADPGLAVRPGRYELRLRNLDVSVSGDVHVTAYLAHPVPLVMPKSWPVSSIHEELPDGPR